MSEADHIEGSRSPWLRWSLAILDLNLINHTGMSMSFRTPRNGPGCRSPRERRVLGVLVEKAKTTPEYYPLTIAAIVTGATRSRTATP